jgi:precorrin-6A/cobalt-precorrin-6A reductase
VTLLLLAGTKEARLLANRLAEAGIDAIASLSGATRSPRELSIPTRIGGFGGDVGFEKYLTDNRISAVIDATHPFANQVSLRTASICNKSNIPILRLVRGEWKPGPGDQWISAKNTHDVAGLLDQRFPNLRRVFLATAHHQITEFGALGGRHMICRVIDDPGPFPIANGRYLVQKPPYEFEKECHLFRELQVEVIVAKNAGGTASRAKLDAARELGRPVIMIERPIGPDAPFVTDIEDAMAWIEGR